MTKNKIDFYNGYAFGEKVSEEGIKNGRLDYGTLERMLKGCIYNDKVRYIGEPEDWNLVNGDYMYDVSSEFIISDHGYKVLSTFTDETVYYNENLDLYVWCIDFGGTSWDYVMTDVKLIS